MTRTGRRLVGAVIVVALVGCAACGSRQSPATTGTTDTAPATGSATDVVLQGELLVSAAASLTDAFADMVEAFTAANPDVEVVLNLAGSQALREQLLEGAPADVFASASTTTTDQVVEAGLAHDPEVFARNRMQIAVPRGNPAGVSGLADFDDEELLIGLCEPTVPCGDFARQVLDQAGVTPAVDTEEPDVRALLTKVELAELDAGITYATDVASTDGAVEGITIPDPDNVEADYPIVVLDGAPNPVAAAAFVAFVLDGPGREVLADFGFATP